MFKIFFSIKNVIASIIISAFAFSVNAQSGCVKVDQIAKWEVLDSTKTIIYDSQGNSITFIIFDSAAYLKKSGETFRFFSSTICRGDRVQTSQGMTHIVSIEPIRK
jgi:hypothetical protein